MAGTVRVKYVVKTSKDGSGCSDILEFDADEWAAKSDAEQEATMRDAAFNEVDWYYVEVGEDEDDDSL